MSYIEKLSRRSNAEDDSRARGPHQWHFTHVLAAAADNKEEEQPPLSCLSCREASAEAEQYTSVRKNQAAEQT